MSKSILYKTPTVVCAFCGMEEPVPVLPRSEHEARAKAHIAVCPDHPIRKVEAEVKRLRNALCKYGVHAEDCPAEDWDNAEECNCGFTKAEEVGP